MINGPFLKAFSTPALALSALLLTTPVLAANANDQANSEPVNQAGQQVCLRAFPDALDQLFTSECIINNMVVLTASVKLRTYKRMSPVFMG